MDLGKVRKRLLTTPPSWPKNELGNFKTPVTVKGDLNKRLKKAQHDKLARAAQLFTFPDKAPKLALNKHTDARRIRYSKAFIIAAHAKTDVLTGCAIAMGADPNFMVVLLDTIQDDEETLAVELSSWTDPSQDDIFGHGVGLDKAFAGFCFGCFFS